MTNGDYQRADKPKDRGVYGSWKTKVPFGKNVLAQRGITKPKNPRPTRKNRKPPKPTDKITGVLTEEQAEKAVEDNNLKLIPKIMDREKWDVGAKLMRHWFGKAASTISTNQSINKPANEDIVTIKWVLSKSDDFKDAREGYKDILNDSAANYTTTNSNKELLESLQNDAAWKLKDLRIGDKKKFDHYPAGAKTSDLHPKHFQSKTVEPGTTANKLVAALANFTFHLLARGEVEILDSSRVRVTITGVGVYVRDSYDFTDDPTSWSAPSSWTSQPLGSWDFEKMKYHGRTNLWGWDTVLSADNKAFRDWRTKNGKGGDFRIFSDIRHENVTPHYSFERQSKYTFAKLEHIVKQDETLWAIAKHHYHDGTLWEKIYYANKNKIGPKPELIQPGMKLIIPSKSSQSKKE